jgi:hypothetical protein
MLVIILLATRYCDKTTGNDSMKLITSLIN